MTTVMAGMLPVVAHPPVFNPPSDLAPALALARALRHQPKAVLIAPGPRHWETLRTCARRRARAEPPATDPTPS
jgi:uncharacterized protein